MRRSLKPDGTWMIVEPYAGDHLEDNLNPVGRIFYSASTTICVPASKGQELGVALGAQAGETRMREVGTSGDFSHFRRAAETPFNLVFEARPWHKGGIGSRQRPFVLVAPRLLGELLLQGQEEKK